MDIVKATEKYEAWLGERIPLIRADLNQKHELMAESPSPSSAYTEEAHHSERIPFLSVTRVGRN